MSSKKWLITLACTLAVMTLLFAGFNFFVDPIGVFGDVILDRYSFNMTNNPRVAKIAYLDEHYEEYDSYIIGCSSTSSLPPEAFERYTDGKYYNMIMYGADMLDVEETTAYLIENYTVKNLILNVFITNGSIYDDESNKITANQHAKVNGESTLAFYSRYLFLDPRYALSKLSNIAKDTYLSQPFDVFDIKTGAYDKKKRDIEPIGALSEYLEAYPGFADYPKYTIHMPQIDPTMDSVRRIKAMCEEAGINLTVVSTPVYIDHYKNFIPEQVEYFYRELAEITPYWNFSLSSASLEPRYFYDETHFRNNLGYMAASRIYGGNDMWIPEDFGVYVTEENVNAHLEGFRALANTPGVVVSGASQNEVDLPILMYHHIAEEGDASVTVSAEAFEHQLQLLRDNGYTPITEQALYNYVTLGNPLPDKPVLITFDDGYMSNYEIAFPLLKEYNMPAVISAIGWSVGQSTYKDTDNPMIEHFGWDEAREMVESGLITIASHTYDMHEWAPFETDEVRANILRLEGEGEDDYIETLRCDIEKSISDIERETGRKVISLAFPGGEYDELSQAIVGECGIKITYSTEVGMNTILRGLPQTTLGLKRYNINGETSDEAFLSYLDGTF